ncbi:uncharacterized protein RAG0_08359 [Rhynchosporium agropyri]|uniref:Hydrophobin n=1 Tax=Rhynchosporium agropyri TaxID=914238 RepID=A0A1E1KQJ9_9HELO|nr:uncharacterized protein RAG0_08359 [Rhynchosporium agropyri]
MVRYLAPLALLVTILSAATSATANTCPPGQFVDCCEKWAVVAPDILRSYGVPEDMIPQENRNIPVGYTCMGNWNCEAYGLQDKCCRDTYRVSHCTSDRGTKVE